MEVTVALLAFIQEHEAAAGHVPDVLFVPREVLGAVMLEHHPALDVGPTDFARRVCRTMVDPVLAGVALAVDRHAPGTPSRCDAGQCAQRYGAEVRCPELRALPRTRSNWAT
jgi:hypothetical protein